jgi:hypothetical protein
MHLIALHHLRVTFAHNGRQERATLVGGRVVKEVIG